MTNYYSNSADYHDDLDRFEARVRAMEAEEALAKNKSADYAMCPNCNPESGRHYNERFTHCLRCGAKLIPPKPVLDAVAIYEAEYERTGDWRKAAAAVEAALGDGCGNDDDLYDFAKGG